MSTPLSIGIIKEGKVPIDKRVPLTPQSILEIRRKFPNVTVKVQPSRIRTFLDAEYKAIGVAVTNDLSDCDMLMGVKEVPIGDLIENKTYFFFSHTIKKQPDNQRLLQNILHKNITLIDYECLHDLNHNRVVAFGYFAGVVGAYNTIKTLGEKHDLFSLKPANQCYDYRALRKQFPKAKLPNIKIAVTGGGRVASGAIDVLQQMNIRGVSPNDYLTKTYKYPVYTQLHSEDYYQSKSGSFIKEEFYQHPENYYSDFLKYAPFTDILLACAYWNPKADKLFSIKNMQDNSFKIKLIGDITCDVNGSIPSTIKATSIDNPVYDFNPFTADEEVPFSSEKNITVMAIDNLPCELSRDASQDFGKQVINHIIPNLLHNDPNKMIENATICRNGHLMEKYRYLEDYVKA
jgi:alanine dehydrogenase